MVCAPIVTSGSSAKDFSSSQDMQSSPQIAASSTPWRAHNAVTSRCRSCSCRVRIQSCRRSKAVCLAEALEVSRRTVLPPIMASTEGAFAITLSSATHHSRPVPSAKSLVTKTVKGAAYSRITGSAQSRLSR